VSTAFVTGGSGFIGQALVRRLVRDGHAVRALARSAASAELVRRAGAVPVMGGLADAGALREGMLGADVVFHLTAQTDLDASRQAHLDVTVEGTRAVLTAAHDTEVPRFVHCSTEAALMAGEPLVDADETAPLRPDSPAHYSAAKAMAEQLVADANSHLTATVIVRPRFVYGPDSNLIAALADLARAGLFAWVGGSRVLTDVTHVDNVVQGHILAWQHGRPGQAYFLTDGRRVVLRDFLTEQLAQLDVAAPTTDLTLEQATARVPPPALWLLSQPCTLNIDKAARDLGYQPSITT
jgi:nucleoside-diphosphate-sugar epimerase